MSSSIVKLALGVHLQQLICSNKATEMCQITLDLLTGLEKVISGVSTTLVKRLNFQHNQLYHSLKKNNENEKEKSFRYHPSTVWFMASSITTTRIGGLYNHFWDMISERSSNPKLTQMLFSIDSCLPISIPKFSQAAPGKVYYVDLLIIMFHKKNSEISGVTWKSTFHFGYRLPAAPCDKQPNVWCVSTANIYPIPKAIISPTIQVGCCCRICSPRRYFVLGLFLLLALERIVEASLKSLVARVLRCESGDILVPLPFSAQTGAINSSYMFE